MNFKIIYHINDNGLVIATEKQLLIFGWIIFRWRVRPQR